MNFNQHEFDIRCEWGTGIEHLLPVSDVIVIVDVLSFSAAVDIATTRGALVYPCPPGTDAARYADGLNAILALPGRSATGGYSLSPSSLLTIPPETRLVLPSPNGSALSAAAAKSGSVRAFCGCLRNASVVARAANSTGGRISVIPAGERWPDGSLRPALEDLVGAGAIIRDLEGTRSPEAEVAVLAFDHFQGRLLDMLTHIGSGQELLARGFDRDLRLAAALDECENVPVLSGTTYASWQGQAP